MINYFTASLDRRKRVCIISREHQRIREYIVNDLVRGCSLYTVEGGYTGEKSKEIQSLLTQEEFASLMAYIRDNHIKAFITASNCSEIYGLWLKHRKRHGRLEIQND